MVIFRFIPTLLIAALAALSLSACMPNNMRLSKLTPGTPLADVTKAFGKPRRVVPLPGGGTNLDYSDQPLSTQCYMITMDADGRVLAARDMWQGVNVSEIKRPMTQKQVSDMMCEPSSKEIAFSGEMVWAWQVIDGNTQEPVSFLAYFQGENLNRVLYVNQREF